MPRLKYFLFLPLAIILNACAGFRDTYTGEFAGRYAESLEPGEEEIRGYYQFALTKVGDKYIHRTYYPETRMLTGYTEYKGEKFMVLHGIDRQWYDNGALLSEATYVNGKLDGPYREFFVDGDIHTSGAYTAGLQTGTWRNYTKTDSLPARLYLETTYKEGQRDGQTVLDKDGTPTRKTSYAADEITNDEHWLDGERVDASVWQEKVGDHLDEKLPLFPGCEYFDEYEERKTCADRKLLEYVYGQIKYPARARNLGVVGTAKIAFVIEKDGSVTNLEVLRGVNADIEAEILRIVRSFPVWEPGRQDGKDVSVRFNLPIKFKLD